MRRLLLALALALLAGPAWAAPTPGTAVNNYSETTTDTTVTAAGIVVAGSNTYLLCHAGARSAAITAATGVSWDPGGAAQAMTQITGGVDNFNTSELWGLKNPSAGTHSATATFNAQIGVGSAGLTCLPFSGVDQTTPTGTAASQSDASDPLEIVVSSAAGELVVAGVTAQCNAALTSGDTSQSSVRTAVAGHCYALAAAAGAASVTMDWTNATSESFLKGVPLKPATATAVRHRVIQQQ